MRRIEHRKSNLSPLPWISCQEVESGFRRIFPPTSRIDQWSGHAARMDVPFAAHDAKTELEQIPKDNAVIENVPLSLSLSMSPSHTS